MINRAILLEIYLLPESLKVEVLHFISFLKKGNSSKGVVNADRKRAFGRAKGKYKMAPDFDEPLDDFKNYMQ